MSAQDLEQRARGLLAAASHFREPVANTRGVLKGNADLVPSQHVHLIAQQEDRL